ncbi:MAG: efflux RND transporter periplasmic adaptor subunit [Desulfobacterium sp.]|jgi:HlyD family secretion protein|nr:efflux RND transporter periplasmic adaptor subunit [Desulfobacterium sp.]
MAEMMGNDIIQEKSAIPHSEIAQTLGLDGAARTRRPWRWVVVLLLAALLAGGGYFKWASRDRGPRYLTQEVRLGDLVVTVSATGTLKPVNQVDVGSEVSGLITRVMVDYNDRVKRGEVLAEMDTDQFQARVRQASATLGSAFADVRQAEATLWEAGKKATRILSLTKKNLVSDQENEMAQASLRRAEAAVESARARVLVAKAGLAVDETNLEKTKIVSPIDGMVLSRSIEPGQTVAASFQTPVLFTLADDLSSMVLHVDVDEADIGHIATGQTALFGVDAYPGRSFPARIISVRNAPRTVQNVVTYETVLAVDNSDLLLRPGMTATAEITTQILEDVLLVPNAALRFTPPLEKTGKKEKKEPSVDPADSQAGRNRVWILDGEKPISIPVTTGTTNGQATEILDGDLRPGLPLLTNIAVTGESAVHEYSRYP